MHTRSVAFLSVGAAWIDELSWRPRRNGGLPRRHGPWCVSGGKFYPQLSNRLKTLMLFNTRALRPGELDGVDYHFRPRGQVEGFKYPIGDARKALDAVAALIEGVVSPGAETWREELIR